MGAAASRILPITWVHMCTVWRVSSQSVTPRAGPARDASGSIASALGRGARQVGGADEAGLGPERREHDLGRRTMPPAGEVLGVGVESGSQQGVAGGGDPATDDEDPRVEDGGEL